MNKIFLKKQRKINNLEMGGGDRKSTNKKMNRSNYDFSKYIYYFSLEFYDLFTCSAQFSKLAWRIFSKLTTQSKTTVAYLEFQTENSDSIQTPFSKFLIKVLIVDYWLTINFSWKCFRLNVYLKILLMFYVFMTEKITVLST